MYFFFDHTVGRSSVLLENRYEKTPLVSLATLISFLESKCNGVYKIANQHLANENENQTRFGLLHNLIGRESWRGVHHAKREGIHTWD